MKLNDILESHFNAIGGLARLSEIRNVRRSGDAQLTQWNGQPVNESGRVEIVAVVGKKSYNQHDFGELFSETSVWNGVGGWKSVMGSSPTILPETEYGRAKSTTYMDPLQAIYEEFGSSVFQQIEDELFRGLDGSPTHTPMLNDVRHQVLPTNRFFLTIHISPVSLPTTVQPPKTISA